MNRIIILDDSLRSADLHKDLNVMLVSIKGGKRANTPSEIIDNFCGSFSELNYALSQFSDRIQTLLTNGSPDLHNYIPELHQLDVKNKKAIIEVNDTVLSYNFKTFFINSKSVLDRVIPFFDHRYGSNLRKFSKKGKSLMNYLETNYKGKNKDDFINLLKNNKQDWLDEIIDLRDQIIHFSALREYISFHFILEGNSGRLINSISDLNEPVIFIGGKEILAEVFLKENYNPPSGKRG